MLQPYGASVKGRAGPCARPAAAGMGTPCCSASCNRGCVSCIIERKMARGKSKKIRIQGKRRIRKPYNRVTAGTDPARWMTPILVDPRKDTPERAEWRRKSQEAWDAADRGDYGPGIALGLFPKDM